MCVSFRKFSDLCVLFSFLVLAIIHINSLVKLVLWLHIIHDMSLFSPSEVVIRNKCVSLSENFLALYK